MVKPVEIEPHPDLTNPHPLIGKVAQVYIQGIFCEGLPHQGRQVQIRNPASLLNVGLEIFTTRDGDLRNAMTALARDEKTGIELPFRLTGASTWVPDGVLPKLPKWYLHPYIATFKNDALRKVKLIWRPFKPEWAEKPQPDFSWFKE